MSYLRGIGDGADPTALIFNSTKYPGTCKPSDKYTWNVFKELQRQINRVLYAKGRPTIAVDGDVGPGTVSALTLALGTSGHTCTEVAQSALTYTSSLKLQADALRAPTTVPAPKQPAPSTLVAAATGVETLAPSNGLAASVADAFANMSSTQKILGIAILGGVGYMLLKKPKARRSTARSR